MMEKIVRFGNALLILVLMAILSGAYYQQFFHHELPCPLCILQRFSICGIALGAMMNLYFGLHTRYFAVSIFSALLGAAVSLRQITLHICPGFPEYGIPVWGYSLYTWAFFTFACSIFAIAIMLFLKPNTTKIKHVNYFEWVAIFIILALLIANTFTTFIECGVGFCPDFSWVEAQTKAI